MIGRRQALLALLGAPLARRLPRASPVLTPEIGLDELFDEVFRVAPEMKNGIDFDSLWDAYQDAMDVTGSHLDEIVMHPDTFASATCFDTVCGRGCHKAEDEVFVFCAAHVRLESSLPKGRVEFCEGERLVHSYTFPERSARRM